jgi:hypothetical protein
MTALGNGAYVLLGLDFSLGPLLFAPTYERGRGLDRLVALFLLPAALLTLTIIVTGFAPTSPPAAIDQWPYPAIQPAGRFIIARCLWRFAGSALCGGLSPQGPPAR